MSEAGGLALVASSTTITATWVLVGEEPGGWLVSYRVKGSGTWLPLEPLALAAREVVIAGLVPSTEYEVQVEALGEEEAAEAEVTTDGPLEHGWLELAPPAGVIERLAVSVTHIYAAGGRDMAGKPVLSRASIEATEPQPVWLAVPGASAASNVLGLAVDGTYLYFVWEAEEGAGTNHIGRVKLDGTGMEAAWVTIPFLAELGSDLLAVNATHLYFSRSDAWIGRVKLDGTGMEAHFVKAVAPHRGGGMVLTRDHIVMTWIGAAGEGATWWARLDGSEAAEGPEHLPRAKGIARLPSGLLLLAEQGLAGEASSASRVDQRLARAPEGPLVALEETATPEDLHTDHLYAYYAHEGVIARMALSALGLEGEEEPAAGSEPERGVAVDFFFEHVPGATFELWLFMDPVVESGYRLTVAAVAGLNTFTFRLDKVVAGEVTTLAETGLLEIVEDSRAIEVAAVAGVVSVLFRHAVLLSIPDTTFVRGFIGLGGEGLDAFGARNFRYGGVVLDTLEREEDPLDRGGDWALPDWHLDTGLCFNATFGWVAAS